MPPAPRPLDSAGLPEGYPFQPDWEVTPRQVKRALDAGGPMVLLDVREPAELGLAAIAEAVVFPMSEIKSRLVELDQYAEDRVVVVCHHGARSMQVAAFLRQQGFEEVHSMAGGIDLWSRDIDPEVARY
ncbi:MAG: rhodanese-like domain-containing protein [Planctomycetota bacterium]